MPDETNNPTQPNEPSQDGGHLPFDDSEYTVPHSIDYTDPLISAGEQRTTPLGDNATEEEDEDDTGDMPPVRDTDVPFNLPYAEDLQSPSDRRNDPHQMVTMPIFKEPGVTDPKKTLAGSGGLDPNPDMPYDSERTVANMPVVTMPSSAQNPNTVPTSVDPRFQRPQNAPNIQNAQGSYTPPPPAPVKKPLPQHRPSPRRVAGLPMGCLYGFIGLVLTMCGGLTLLVVVAAAVFIPYIEERWSGEIDRVDNYQAFQSTFVYDRYGSQLFEAFGEGRRSTVSYDKFPQDLINATIAIEDGSFRSNLGIDVPATTVAFFQFVGAGGSDDTAGGSTITQQLVRNVLFDPEKRAERSVQRKLEEILLAVLLTQRRTKDDILALYLNEIYYGNLSYGAQTASQTFFGKDVQNLTLGEAALLAGLPQAPANLDPLNPDPNVQNAVYTRWRLVLDEMVDKGFITAQQRDEAFSQGLSFNPPQTSLKAPHFTVYAQREFERLMVSLGYTPDQVARGGYMIFTTIDQNVNDIALQAARSQVASLAGNRVSNAAVLVMKPLTGEILGMVGSIDYNSTTIDGRVNVTTAFRQPGSTMKAFTYAAAMERGMTPADVLWDTRTEIGIAGQPLYTPVNYDRTFHGPMNMRRALANSYNIPAVQTIRMAGVDYLLQFLQRFGVETLGNDASRYGLSLTLGGGELSLVELLNGYNVFANLGSYVRPTAILCVLNAETRQIIYQYENGCPQGTETPQTVNRQGFGKQVLDPRIAYIITDILSDNVARSPAMGTNSPLRTVNIESAVKTGTTDDFKDNWTVGYTSNVSVGVWVGNNDGTPMANVSGLAGAAPIWNTVMSNIYGNPARLNAFAVGGQLRPDKPAAPGGISIRQMCDVRRVSDPSPTCPTLNEWAFDGGVGIPDENGNLVYQPLPQQPQFGDFYIQDMGSGVYRALVVAIPPQTGASIQLGYNPAAGEKQPPAPKYCLVPVGFPTESFGTQDLVFISLPNTSQGDGVEAERYAQSNNLATLPRIACPQDIAGLVGGGDGLSTAFITSPANGQDVTGVVAILGTASFDTSQVAYYLLQIRGGLFPDWTQIETTYSNPVVNGQLSTLFSDALQDGQYGLRLVLVGRDNNIVLTPYEITINVR